MSSISIIVGIVVLLGALVCYAFITQTVQRKQEQRKRLLAALKARSRTFKFMLSGFPPGFLSRELTTLVRRSLAEVSEQLVKLEPDEPKHLQDLQLMSAELSDTKKQPVSHQPPQLETHQQIKEVKACLEELHKYIVKLEEKNTLSKNQAIAYRAQIKQLVLQISIDGYELHGKKAIHSDKLKLAVHYYELAFNLLVREGKTGPFEKRIASLKRTLVELRAKLQDQDPNAKLSNDEINEQAEVQAAWDKMQTGDDLWKKKNVYD